MIKDRIVILIMFIILIIILYFTEKNTDLNVNIQSKEKIVEENFKNIFKKIPDLIKHSLI